LTQITTQSADEPFPFRPLQRLINYSLAQGLLSQALDVHQIIDTTYLQQADRK
jgi:hypothetical protein